MKNPYDIFVPAGEKECCIRIFDAANGDMYFVGYDFMGGREWSRDLANAYRMTLDEARQIASDMLSADVSAEPVAPADRKYLLRVRIDGEDSYSVETGSKIADIYDQDQECGYIDDMDVWEFRDGNPVKIKLLDLVVPILRAKREIEQEYRDYCDAVNEYGYDFEGRDL